MSDYDPQFCGHFWDQLIFLLEMIITFSMTLHPQTDRMAEVTNYTVEWLLYIHALWKNWVQNLPLEAMLFMQLLNNILSDCFTK